MASCQQKLVAVLLRLHAVCAICLLVTGPILAQAPSALRGLGEPAAPESIQEPGKLGPPSPLDMSQPQSPELKQPLPIELGPGAEPTRLKSGVESNALKEPFTLSGAVRYAEHNYPMILKAQAEVNAARQNVTVQKLNEYMPDGLIQFQEIYASHNKLTQIFYGSPVFPANSGPGFNNVNMDGNWFSGLGFNVDWAPIDFGLHKARINLAKSQYKQVVANFGVTKLDMQIAAANAFLDVVAAKETVKAAEENVRSFEDFLRVVDAQVKAQLKPAADSALAEAQLANARNQLFRAHLGYETATANLANALGLGGIDVSIAENGIASFEEAAGIQKEQPVFEQVPILRAANATVLTAVAQRRVLSREYYPVFHWLSGIQGRGAGLNVAGRDTSHQGYGLAPIIPNYQVALIANWAFLDWPRLHWEKKVQDQRIIAQQRQYDLVLQNLKTENVRARAQVKAALAIAANMPVQVQAAVMAVHQARARYSAGLASVAQVAESNQVLAQSRMQEAVARVSVWRAMLAIASVHGDLAPFLSESDRVQRGTQ